MSRFDRFQQRHSVLGFTVAVLKKFSDDQAGHLAALIGYFAFLSLFPLLLVFVTVLGFVLQGSASLQNDIYSSALRDVPVLGPTIHQNIHSLRGSGPALAIGIMGALWAGLGVTQASQSAFNRVWNVPFRARPDFLRSRLRGLAVLGVLGALSIISFGLTALTATVSLGPLTSVAGHVVAGLINLALFAAAFRLLTAGEVPFGELWPGALLAAVSWQCLQEFGSYLIATRLRHASEIYGTFGFVIGLIATLHLAAQMTLVAAEINVVRSQRLWPRSLVSPLIDGDRRALRSSAEVEERVDEEHVSVRFG